MNYTYEIGGKKYIQKPLVLGQMRQLINLLKGMEIPAGDLGGLSIISLLGNKLPEAIAIVLVQEGMSLKDKDIQALTADLEFEISPETAVQVVEDFFDCNPIASLSEKLNGAVGQISKKMTAAGQKAGSKT